MGTIGAELGWNLVGACLLQFPNVFAVWVSEQKRWHAINHTDTPEDAETATARGDVSKYDPTCEAVLQHEAAQAVLGTIQDAKIRAAVQMVARGFTFAEASRSLGLSARAVEGRLHRLRSRTARSGRYS